MQFFCTVSPKRASSSTKAILLASLFLLLSATICQPARAQSAASVRGLVTDPQHAPVADTPIKITNLATKKAYNVRTDAEGNYEIKDLPAGEYGIDIQVSGFKTVQISGIKVGVSEAVTQDVTLELENASQSVRVSGLLDTDLKTNATPLIASVEAVKSDSVVFTSKDIEALHPNTVFDVLQTVPGFQMTYQGRQGNNSMSLRGGPVMVIIDGAYLTQTSRQLAFFPVQLIDTMIVTRDATALAIGPLTNFITGTTASSGGTSAVGIQGFVIIKTKRSSAREAGFVSYGGTWQTALGHVYVGSKNGNWDYRVAYTYNTTQGGPTPAWTLSERSASMNFHGGYTGKKLSAEFSYYGERGFRANETPVYVLPTWTAAGGYDGSVIGQTTTPSGVFNPSDADVFNFNSSQRWNDKNRTVLQYGFYNAHVTSPGTTYGEQDNTEGNLNLAHTTCFSGDCLTGGVQFIKFIAPLGISPKAGSTYLVNGIPTQRLDEAMLSWFAQDEWLLPSKRLTLDGGIRSDKLHYGWLPGATSKTDVWIPPFYTVAAGVAYQATNRLRIGTRYGYVQAQPPSNYVTTNGSKLSNQSQQRAEVSAYYKLDRHFNINLAPYGYHTGNASSLTTGCPGFPANTNQLTEADGSILYCVTPGGASIWTYGIDSDISGQIYGPIQYDTGYGYVMENNDPNNYGMSHHFFHAQADYLTKTYFGNFNMIYVGPSWYSTASLMSSGQPGLPGYFPNYPFANYVQLNANAGYNFKLFGKAYTFTFTCNNMNNQHATTNTSSGSNTLAGEFGAFPNPGRNFTFQLAGKVFGHE